MYYQLFDDASIKSRETMGKTTLPSGVIDRLFGFDIYIKPTVAVVDNGNLVKAVGAAGAATDDLVAVAYHETMVARAMGSIKVFANEDDAKHYGTIMSAEVGMGASQMYTNATGIVAIQQQA